MTPPPTPSHDPPSLPPAAALRSSHLLAVSALPAPCAAPCWHTFHWIGANWRDFLLLHSSPISLIVIVVVNRLSHLAAFPRRCQQILSMFFALAKCNVFRITLVVNNITTIITIWDALYHYGSTTKYCCFGIITKCTICLVEQIRQKQTSLFKCQNRINVHTNEQRVKNITILNLILGLCLFAAPASDWVWVKMMLSSGAHPLPQKLLFPSTLSEAGVGLSENEFQWQCWVQPLLHIQHILVFHTNIDVWQNFKRRRSLLASYITSQSAIPREPK